MFDNNRRIARKTNTNLYIGNRNRKINELTAKQCWLSLKPIKPPLLTTIRSFQPSSCYRWMEYWSQSNNFACTCHFLLDVSKLERLKSFVIWCFFIQLKKSNFKKVSFFIQMINFRNFSFRVLLIIKIVCVFNKLLLIHINVHRLNRFELWLVELYSFVRCYKTNC